MTDKNILDKVIIKGTTHLLPSSEIISIIQKENPDVIGVEFDKTRLNVYMNPPSKETPEYKKDDSLLGKISNAIKSKAEAEKVEYGSDMITASKYAIGNNIPLVLLDRDITEVSALMQKIPQNELQGFLQELSAFEQMDLKQSTQNINPNDVLNELRSKYPVSYEFLIVSREMFIVNQILKTIIKYPNKKILIFLGEGHLSSILDSLKEIFGKIKEDN